jgi:transposase
MPAPLSLDIRTRFINAYLAGEGSLRELGRRFCIGEATADRWWSRFKATGEIEPRPSGGSKSKISEDDEEVIRYLIDQNPDARIIDLLEVFKAELGRDDVSASALKRAIKRMGITRKKSPSMRRKGTRRVRGN